MPDSEFQCQGDKKTFTDEQGIAMPARSRANAASAAPHRFSFREVERAFSMMQTKADGIIKPLIVLD